MSRTTIAARGGRARRGKSTSSNGRPSASDASRSLVPREPTPSRRPKQASQWDRHLLKRRTPLAPKALFPNLRSAFTWGLSRVPCDGPVGNEPSPRWNETLSLLGQLHRLTLRGGTRAARGVPDAVGWMAESSRRAANLGDADLGHALEALAWCHAMVSLPRTLGPNRWWDLFDHLVRLAEEASVHRDQPESLTQQLLCGELPLSLAWLFPEVEVCRGLASSGLGVLRNGRLKMLDASGIPRAEQVDSLSALVACWIRARIAERQVGGLAPDEEDDRLLRGAVQEFLRLTRADGTVALSKLGASPSSGWLEEEHLHVLWKARPPRADVLPELLRVQRGRKQPLDRPKALPSASMNSEVSRLAVLASTWSSKAPRLVVDYRGSGTTLELSLAGEVVALGTPLPEVARAGSALQPASDWEEVCFVHNEHADYLEIELALTEGVRLQRQFLLARQDDFLLMADVVLADQRSDLSTTMRLPLAPGVRHAAEQATREGYLVGRRRLARLLPIAFPEWRSAMPACGMIATETGLEMTVHGSSVQALYAPLFFDLRPRRFARHCTWRTLTIADRLTRQPRDVAAGYRVQLGQEQWLIYRSLAEPAGRTLLGHNLVSEFLVGRFLRTGLIEPLVEIE